MNRRQAIIAGLGAVVGAGLPAVASPETTDPLPAAVKAAVIASTFTTTIVRIESGQRIVLQLEDFLFEVLSGLSPESAIHRLYRMGKFKPYRRRA
jgi:hypothetical protein